MKLMKLIRSSIFQGLSLLFLLGYLLGVLNLHFSDKNNYCFMTYMFEYPQFVHLSMPENKIYPQYALFAYSEGRFTERARKMWFDGVPVLFIPGNSGSHMQARSLASVALRKALSGGYDYHFDYFAISYNEELSGLYGGVLQSQTRFAAACIEKILDLYKENNYIKSVPTSVILIGHSMGGLVAKRLLVHPSTVNSTSIAITLAAPLEAPLINFDIAMNDYYLSMNHEWENFVRGNQLMTDKKMLLSFGNGPRDLLMPSGLTLSNDSDINTLTTAIPGVWVSPDHVCIVWCKQLVMAINKYLFSIVNPMTKQISYDKQLLMSRAKQYFQANRSMTINPEIPKANVTMTADAFWYEDNRRMYQVQRPEIDKTTYLMIRLVKFPQNRFVAVEAVNVSDKDWIYGCNAKHTYNTHRYCKHAVSLTELSRWSGAATEFRKRKLATVNLHNVMEHYPDWSHVVVKVSPTRKPVTMNIDINDYASRQIFVDLPTFFEFGKRIVKPETERDSLYYELILRDFNAIHEAYLLYVEPTANCKASRYHVSAELHVPWAKNHEYYHYFTHLKRSPMKLRLFKTNPNLTLGLETTEHAKITLLLDPQCQFILSISSSWYNRLAQFTRNYGPVLIPYVAAIVLLAARSIIMNFQESGSCLTIHGALMSEGVKPYYCLVFSRLATKIFLAIPLFSFMFESASWRDLELQYFIKSLLVLPAYMTALGIVNIVAAAIMGAMVFSSQIAHRLLFKIVWRGGGSLAEKMATGLHKLPMIVSAALVCAVPLSCGAASLAAGAAFYAFMLSKMYEEYLEDYVYKIMAKLASKVCRMFNSTRNKYEKSETNLISKALSDAKESNLRSKEIDEIEGNDKDSTNNVGQDGSSNTDCALVSANKESERKPKEGSIKGESKDLDEDFNSINFHMMLFFMWITVTLVNVPALLTWARNFKYSMVLKPDTSYHTGLVMSVCSSCIWQINGPRRNLKHYEAVSSLLFTMAIFILALGPLSLTIVNYGITFTFVVITLQQVCDKEDVQSSTIEGTNESKNDNDEKPKENQKEEADNIQTNDCDPCNENRIFDAFKNLQDKFDLTTMDNL
ncbi:GPI inositol-deacylase [Bombyx mori]|uniref:GPI inositol-deacylase n=1 Tax=Bombyx mori TaxID=7091 RepID=A0A8R2M3F0_BOMMO|nr:GPI inositol-deacylase isoform X1 [Bombyx mori]